MKIYISAMGTNKNIVETQLVAASGELTDHLIKLYLYPSTEYRNHWKQEIYSFVPRCPKLKNTNKYPDAQFIFDCISAYLDTTETAMYYVMQEYPSHTPERYDAQELEQLMAEYLTWLADELSANGRVQSQAVYNKLDEIGF